VVECGDDVDQQAEAMMPENAFAHLEVQQQAGRDDQGQPDQSEEAFVPSQDVVQDQSQSRARPTA
jgi:hypothetical protein